MSHKAIFFDRDDTLIDDPGYISHPDQVQLLDGVPEALNGFYKMGYKLVVVTNQSGIARGILTEDTLKTVHDRFKELLAEQTAYVDGIYYCPYHEDGVIDKYRRESDLRKPNPGMLLQATEEMDLDLSMSWCVGDSLSDVEAGQRAGCYTILIDPMSPTGRAKPGQIRPDHVAVNLREALNIVKQFEAAEKHHAPEPVTSPVQEPAIEPDTEIPEAAEPEPREPDTEHPEAAKPEPCEPEPDAPLAVPDHVVVEEVSRAQVPAAPPRRKKRRRKTPRPLPPHEPSDPAETETANTQQLLQGILDQLKSMQRDTMFDEFSLLRFVAGVAQIGVFVCLLISVWLLLSPQRPFDAIFTTLGYAVVLQVMCLTLTMQGRR
ncbi:MAG: HAD-IIIA family hydrolase [Planctomycetes bacterium]|nr:HAD-IIIA family hydrolase [Planctomycetota bacterium]